MTLTLLNNRYQVLHVLGSGGFGETFLAEDTQMPSNRRCVIKQLRPIQNNPQIYQLVQERFQREAAILEDLGGSSNQIPALYAYFQSEGQFYVVQEWVEGDTLTAKVRQQGILSESAVREILVTLLPVLEYVHSKRIIHRDIKPDNIILRHRDRQPVLIDFGAVRESMGTVFNSQGNPTSSIVIGTPGYMPSEQAAGRPVYSSDLYSLGLTAIYLLTGKQPQELETDPRTGEIIWHRHALSVSPTLAAVIDRAIAYHPRERYATAREMLEALQIPSTPSPPTFITPPPPPPPVQPPTLISSHQNQQQNAVSATNNLATWQQGVIIGGVIGVFVLGGLWLIKEQVSNQPQPLQTVAASPSNSPSTDNQEISNQNNSNRPSSSQRTNTNDRPQSNSSTSDNPVAKPIKTPNISSNTDTSSASESTLTQADAKTLINNWLQAKRVMFAPPYDPQPASELTTGVQYDQVAGSDGSINSLKTDGHYYKYGVQRIDNIEEFSVNGNQAVIQVKVTEDRTLFDKNGKILPKETDFKTRTVRYSLQLVNQRWKIASTDIISN